MGHELAVEEARRTREAPGEERQPANQPAALLLLHNGFDSRRTWDAVVPLIRRRVGRDRAIVVYNRRGYSAGDVDARKKETGPRDLVEEGVGELRVLIEHLAREWAMHAVVPHDATTAIAEAAGAAGAAGAARSPAAFRVVLWGHCVGGAIALVYARRYPQRVVAVFGEAVGFYSSEGLAAKAQWLAGPFDSLDGAYRDHFVHMHGVARAAAFWERIRSHTDSYILNPAYDIRPQLRGLSVPVCLLQGTRDVYFTAEHAAAGLAAVTDGVTTVGPGTQLQIVAGGGHDLHSAQPVETVARFAAWLRQVDAVGATVVTTP